MKYNVAIVGATGIVGQHIKTILEEREFPINEIYFLGSQKSSGKKVSFGDKTLEVQLIDDFSFENIHFAFFCANSDISRKFATLAKSAGAIIIDKSDAFRMDENIPLCVPEVNGGLLKGIWGNGGKIISSPNCVAIPLSIILKNLGFGVKRVQISTYQSISGIGYSALDQFLKESRAISADLPMSTQDYAFTLNPVIGEINENNFSDEEVKISQEIPKILGNNIDIVAQCVRVPVFISHCGSVFCEFEEKINVDYILKYLQKCPSIQLYEDKVSPLVAQRHDYVFVSRVRRDNTVANGIVFWFACNNLRKGAALNAVEIAEHILWS